jgi:uncharacterized ion transporter superfamily protein YfcC
MGTMDNKDCKTATNYNLSFIGDKTEMKKEKMFDNFDINYLNLNYLPVSYYPIYRTDLLKEITNNFSAVSEDKKKIKDEFDKLMRNMENNKLSYNKYTILPIILIILIVWIFIIMFFLKYIHYYYNIYYIYFITFVIIALLIFGSLWFLYVNSELI